MKRIIFIAMLAIAAFTSKPVMAQITLEHTYDSAFGNLYMVNLEVEGMKYAWRDDINISVRLYNLDHSIFKIMDYSSVPNLNASTILYVSEHLFNTDNLIEYMMINFDANHIYHTYIINELGSIIFTADSLSPTVKPNAPQTQLPIYNTTNGTKMILSGSYNGNTVANVYSLTGHLSNSIQQITNSNNNNLSMENIYPNPSNGNNTTIEFHLPQGENKGEIVIYNMQGMEQKRYEIDNTFHNLIINNSDLHSGTYFYQLLTNNAATGAKKMIVIR